MPLAVATLATVLIAAVVDGDSKWARLRSLPRAERARLTDALQKFDVLYKSDRQKAIKDLDRRINELEPAQCAHYLSVLRRYHNWLDRLPENKQTLVKDASPGERMAIVKKLAAEYPVAPARPLRFLQFIDVGDYSPFELAAFYQIWKGLTPTERGQIDKMAGANRVRELHRRAAKKKLPTEIKPADFNEEQALANFKNGSELLALPQRKVLKLLLDNDDGKTDVLRRQAINAYYLEPAVKSQIKAVDPDNLVKFLAGFPGWLRSTFDHYPPDEATRRLTIVYRLVYPAGTEINSVKPSSKDSKSTKPGAATTKVVPRPAAKTDPAATGDSPF